LLIERYAARAYALGVEQNPGYEQQIIRHLSSAAQLGLSRGHLESSGIFRRFWGQDWYTDLLKQCDAEGKEHRYGFEFAPAPDLLQLRPLLDRSS
jgi:hypothetical protein